MDDEIIIERSRGAAMKAIVIATISTLAVFVLFVVALGQIPFEDKDTGTIVYLIAGLFLGHLSFHLFMVVKWKVEEWAE